MGGGRWKMGPLLSVHNGINLRWRKFASTGEVGRRISETKIKSRIVVALSCAYNAFLCDL